VHVAALSCRGGRRGTGLGGARCGPPLLPTYCIHRAKLHRAAESAWLLVQGAPIVGQTLAELVACGTGSKPPAAVRFAPLASAQCPPPPPAARTCRLQAIGQTGAQSTAPSANGPPWLLDRRAKSPQNPPKPLKSTACVLGVDGPPAVAAYRRDDHVLRQRLPHSKPLVAACSPDRVILTPLRAKANQLSGSTRAAGSIVTCTNLKPRMWSVTSTPASTVSGGAGKVRTPSPAPTASSRTQNERADRQQRASPLGRLREQRQALLGRAVA
jgi:hypothetical protein